MGLADAEGFQEWRRLEEDLVVTTVFAVVRLLDDIGAESVSAKALAGCFLVHFSLSGAIFYT